MMLPWNYIENNCDPFGDCFWDYWLGSWNEESNLDEINERSLVEW